MTERADWTVMVYLAGDNSLTDECLYSLTEMRKAKRTEGVHVNVFAQFDPDDKFLPTSRFNIREEDSRTGRLGDAIFDTAKSTGVGKPRFKHESKATKAREGNVNALKDVLKGIFKEEMGKGAFAGVGREAISELLDQGSNEIIPDTDSGDPATLYDFISLGIERFPAHRYMVVLSGHGAGTEEDFLLKDNSSGRSLSIPNLQKVFSRIQEDFWESERREKEVPVIDIIGMDACCMSMAEIAYELKGLANILVASESYSPAAGWPYREIIESLESLLSRSTSRNSENVSSEFAEAIVSEFVNFYADYTLGGLSVDQAALNVGYAEELKDRVKSLAEELTSTLKPSGQRKSSEKSKETALQFKDDLLLAHWEAQSYSGELFVDLVDFCDCLKKHCQLNNVEQACDRVIEFLKSQKFVLNSSYSGPAYQYSHGVSIYFPWSSVSPFYKETSFANHSGWADFLDVYTNETRGEPRREPNVPEEILIKTKEIIESNKQIGVLGAANASTSGAPRNLRQVSGRQVSGRQVVGKGSENPIVSMRNPPLVYVPDRNITAKVALIRAQGKLFLEDHLSNGSRKIKDQREPSKK